MKVKPLSGLVIRTAQLRQPGLGYIYAADPKKEATEEPHAVTFRYKDGVFTKGAANFDASSLAVISKPEVGLVAVSGPGYYSAVWQSGTRTGDIVADALPVPSKPRSGGLRSVAEVDGRAYAVGLRGIAYLFNDERKWIRIDDGLPDSFNIQAIHGFNDDDVYAVGREGQLWHSDGKRWSRLDLPTSATLTTVRCAANGTVYVAGHGGTLLKGRAESWAVVPQTACQDDVWDVDWFGEQLYVSTMAGAYRLLGSNLEAIDFGDDRPKSFYQLTSVPGELWSVGEFDIMSFDGSKWSRVV